jgi:coiled-coil domain-containing protein 77
VRGEALSLRCEALQAQLSEQKRFAAERVAALQEDRAIREQDAAATAAVLSATADELAAKLQGAEEALRRTVRDFVVARQQRDAAELEAVASRSAADAERRAAAAALEKAEAQAAAALQRQQQELEMDSQAAQQVWFEEVASACAMDLDGIVHRIAGSGKRGWSTVPRRTLACPCAPSRLQCLQAELEQRAEELLKFEIVHKLLRAQLETRAADAERRAAKAVARSRDVQLRRAHEMEGWASDVGQLRKRIAGVERRLTQWSLEQRLPDDERRDALLAKHARCG